MTAAKPERDTPYGSPPELSFKQAVEASGVSASTLRRRRDDLVKHGARFDGRTWRIPITALIAIGVMTPTTKPDDTHHDSPHDSPSEDLKTQLQDALRRAELAEAIAAERLRVIEAQNTALKLLEAAPAAATRRGWWRRLRKR